MDFATSNLRGAKVPLYLSGALVEANYPFGPLAGTAFNITTMSYAGGGMGLFIDRAWTRACAITSSPPTRS